MSINAIFAADSRGGMGFRGSLPWPHSKEDMIWFKSKTDGQIVVMGRNTWDDPKMPKPLPNRINCIFTNRFFKMPNVYCLSGDYKEQLLKLEQEFPNKEIFVIGGPSIIEAVRPITEKLYLTHMKGSYNIDTRIDLRTYLRSFQITSAGSGTDCTFVTYKNVDPFII